MEINKTSAQKLDNNVQVAQATTTKPAIKTAEGTSFKDAVSMMSDIEVANNTKTDIKPANTTETVGKNADAVKDFKFISTTENKTSFDKTLNKENLTQNQKLSIHEKAEKELVKEIVLVNNKQVELKANKNENQIAQVSTAIKSDKEIETEKNEKVEVKNVETKDVKPVVTDEIEFVASDKFAKNTSSSEKINTVSNNIKSLLKDEKTSKIEKVDNKKSVISNSKVDNDTNIIKNTVATEVGEIKPVDLNKPEKPAKDMKVITFAPISPVQDLKENLTTSKTSDIVKFIDANLSTKNTKKASKSNSASSAKKAEEKSIKMTEADAKFFQNLVENNNQVSQDSKATDMANQATLKDVEEAHSAKVSKSLLNALKESQETNKSFRVDFDKDLSVILKVNRNGRISAEFLPGDAAVEQYLKSNIPLLKQKFNDEGLEYENLSYRDQSRKDNKEEKRNNRNSNKENGYE